jgi:hypothetical protein
MATLLQSRDAQVDASRVALLAMSASGGTLLASPVPTDDP